jgi:8-oxo-dGTP pyrophosphatase MutT (NUDIX family)
VTRADRHTSRTRFFHFETTKLEIHAKKRKRRVRDPILKKREFEILVAGRFDLVVHYHQGSIRQYSPEERTLIDRIWGERLAECREKGIPLYDGSLFRLLDYEADDSRMVLRFGETGYKEYVGTRTDSYARQRRREELSNPMAVCAVVHTADGKILVEKRVGTDVYAGRYHVIGGFADREHDMVAANFSPFDAISREVREETGLSIEASAFTCLGLCYDLLTPHPELCFMGRGPGSREVVEAFRASDNEIQALEFLEDSAESVANFIREHHGRISATGEGCLLLYGLFSYGREWFNRLTSLLS